MALAFFPRGGSAHVARALATRLPGCGWSTRILTGSLSIPGRPGEAREFYAGLDVRPLDYTPALAAPDPLRHDPPFHASYEDRPGAPDRVMAAVPDDVYEHHVRVWCRELAAAGAAEADVLHLHHLTPINEAAALVAPDVPVVGHIHGTELLMLEAAAADPRAWPHTAAWAGRMARWARRCERLLLLSPTQLDRAERMLGVDSARCVCVPNGFDPEGFEPRPLDRPAHWRRHLVEAPQGWAPGGEAGSVAYREEDLAPFADPDAPVLLYVGRFTEVKRIGLLVRAFAAAQERFAVRAPLVLLGGFPGEWEGEHPLEAVAAAGARDVFLAGWHGHDELPAFFNASDVVVLPSVREQFGQVLVEGMACGLPAIAVDRFGPSEIVRDGETGWLVEPDDLDGLARALAEAVGDAAERRRRGKRARADVRERFSWPALAARVADVYAAAAAARPAARADSVARRAPPAGGAGTVPN